MRSSLFFLLFLLLVVPRVQAQPFDEDRFDALENALAEYAMEYSRVDKLIDITITGTIQEFALAFSKETKLNLTVDPSINKKVVTNFSDTRPRDILLHLCKFYDLDLTFSGSIISLIPHDAPKVELIEREPDITFNSYNNRLELKLKKDTLDDVVRRISELSKKNVIATKGASNLVVDGYIGSVDFEDALEQLTRRNDLVVTKDQKGYYIIEQKVKVGGKGGGTPGGSSMRSGGGGSSGRSNVKNLQVKVRPVDSLGNKYLTIDAENVLLGDVLKQVSEQSGKNFFLFVEPKEKVSFKLRDVTYQELLDHLLDGTNYAYKEDKGVYLIGDNTAKGLKDTRVLQLQHRSVKDLSTFIPKDIADQVEVKEFMELNSLIVSGASSSVAVLEEFILEVDKSVPVVMIELLIIDVQYNRETRAGFEAGLASEPVTPGGKVFGGIDFTFSSKAINKLLGLIAGNGIVNLGQVKPNFYATLQAVEENGYVKVRSKPRLSTLNGVEATLALGETRYYLNERTTLQGNQNPISLQDRRYEAVNADFSIRIIPVVSGDEFVTLEIEVNQSDFIGQVQTDAPPPQVNRTFNSNIRLLDQEMIVLGGLESKSVEDSGSGLPWLARVPIIKWFFSKRRRAKSKSKLLVFVKPTVIY